MADNPIYWRHFKGLPFHLCRWSNIVPYTVFGTLEWSQRALQLRDLRISVSWSSILGWRFYILVRMLSNNCIFWGETAMTHIYSILINSHVEDLWNTGKDQWQIPSTVIQRNISRIQGRISDGNNSTQSAENITHILYSRFYISLFKVYILILLRWQERLLPLSHMLRSCIIRIRAIYGIYCGG